MTLVKCPQRKITGEINFSERIYFCAVIQGLLCFCSGPYRLFKALTKHKTKSCISCGFSPPSLLPRFKTLLANRPCGENTCIEISNVKYHIFQVRHLRMTFEPLHSCFSLHNRILFFLLWQLVMQYLYFGGTESLHIRNSDVMEVRPLSKLSQPSREKKKLCFLRCLKSQYVL